MNKKNKKSPALLIKVLPFVLIVIGLKLLLHEIGYEFISINPVFSGIIAATIFLLGFLLTGVLQDFKESEKIPGEIAAIIMTIFDELEGNYKMKKNSLLLEGAEKCHDLALSVQEWFQKSMKTKELKTHVDGFYSYLIKLDDILLPNYIVRLKQEHHSLRKLLIRSYTIRETSFIFSGYLISITAASLLIGGLIIAKIEPFYESLFFVSVISYLLIFLILLIKDLDNPFGQGDFGSSEDVSIKSIDDEVEELKNRLEILKKL